MSLWQDGYFSSLTSSRCLAVSIKSHSVLPWQTSFLFSGVGSIMWYLMWTIKMENVCWADNRIIDMYWALNYVKPNGATGLQKAYLGHGAGFVTATAVASQGCTWKVLDGVGAAFHVEWLLAVWAHPSQLRPAWNKPFSSPSPLAPNWVVSLLSAVSVLTSDPLARLIVPLVICYVTCWTPSSAHFRCPRLFFILTFTPHLPLNLALTWLLTY